VHLKRHQYSSVYVEISPSGVTANLVPFKVWLTKINESFYFLTEFTTNKVKILFCL